MDNQFDELSKSLAEEVSRRLQGQVEVVKDLHETFYGMREFIVRDLNGFWITFGQDSPR